MLEEKDRKAAIDFVRCNVDGLEVIRSLDDAWGIIATLSDEGMRPRDLVDRMRHSRHLDALLRRFLNSHFGGGIHEEVAMRVWEYRSDPVFLDRMVPDGIYDILSKQTIYDHLLETVPLDEFREFVPKARWEYWTRRVRRFIAKKDLDRAYDEMFKSFHNDTGPYGLLVDELARLVRELADAVGAKLPNAPNRKIQPRSKVDLLLNELRKLDSFTDRGRRTCHSLILLHNYFGERKARRRIARDRRKLSEYEARLK